MKKQVFGKKLSRGGGARRALFKSLIRALTLSGKIETTKGKAKAIVGEIDGLVVLAKKEKTKAILAFFGNDRVLTQNFIKTARSFKGTTGGYTKFVNLPPRKGDGAEIVRLEWTEKVEVVEEKKEAKKEGKTVKGDKTKKVAAKAPKKLKKESK